MERKISPSSPACLGAPVSPEAAWFNFLQAPVLLVMQMIQWFKQKTRSIKRKATGEQVTFSLMDQEGTKGDF